MKHYPSPRRALGSRCHCWPGCRRRRYCQPNLHPFTAPTRYYDFSSMVPALLKGRPSMDDPRGNRVQACAVTTQAILLLDLMNVIRTSNYLARVTALV